MADLSAGDAGLLRGNAASNILRRTSELLVVPYSTLDPEIPFGVPVIPNFAVPVIVAPPPNERDEQPYDPEYAQVPDAVAGSVLEPAYEAIDTILKFDPVPASVEPIFGAAELPTATPNVAVPTPPTDIPYAAQPLPLTPPDLSGGKAYVPALTPRDELYHVRNLKFSPIGLEPFEVLVPEADIPDAPLYSVPTTELPDMTAYAEVLEQILHGGMPYNSIEEQQLFDGSVSTMDREMADALEALAVEAASKGHPLPTPEMITKSILLTNKVREGADKANEGVRDQIFKERLELQTAAVGASTSLDGSFSQWYAARVKAAVDVQRINVELAKNVFNSALVVLQEKQRIQGIVVDAYRKYIGTVEKQQSAALSGRDLDKARADTYSADVTMYGAQSGTSQSIAQAYSIQAKFDTLPIEAYSDYVDSTEASMIAARTNLGMFENAVRAFDMFIDSDVAGINTAIASMMSTQSAISVDRGNAQAQRTAIEAETSRLRASTAMSDADVRAIETALTTYREYGESYRQYLATMQERLSTEADKLAAYANATGAVVQYTRGWNEAEASRVAAENSMRMAMTDQNTRQQALTAQAQAANARIEAGMLGARATAAAGSAQSAYGVTSSMLHIGGSTSASDNSSDSDSQTFNDSATRGWSKNRSKTASASGG